MASREIARVETTPPPVHQSSEQQHFQLMQRKATLFANSPLIPDALRAGGAEQALANCYIGLTMAEAMGENPLTVLQNIHIVKGKAGFSAQFMIARANASGVFKGCIGWRIKGQGDGLEVTAFATLADTGEEVSFTASMAMARAEEWSKNPKYRSMPELMLRYRSATFLVRLYAPQVMFGYQTAEEVEDVSYTEVPQPRLLTKADLEAQANDTGDVTGDPQPEATTNQRPTEPEPDPAYAPLARADGQPGYDLSAGASDDWAAWLDDFRADLDRAENVIAANNLYDAAEKDQLVGAPEEVVTAAKRLRDERVEAIKAAAKR